MVAVPALSIATGAVTNAITASALGAGQVLSLTGTAAASVTLTAGDLAAGAYAGNLTVTGSVANIIVIEKAREDAPISFLDYMRAGVPVTLATLALGLLWLRYF